MKKIVKKFKSVFWERKLSPERPEERRKIIQEAVKRTVKEYGEALKKMGSD